jgi:hypothetical protein
MTGKPIRRLSLTETLVLAAVLVGGLFGSLLDRSLVSTPAWQRLGVVAWANYSRHADLGNGDIVYPIGAILWWGLVIGAAVAYRRDAAAPRAAGRPLYLALGSVLGAIGSTIIAAPVMQHVGTVSDGDLTALPRVHGWPPSLTCAASLSARCCSTLALRRIRVWAESGPAVSTSAMPARSRRERLSPRSWNQRR